MRIVVLRTQIFTQQFVCVKTYVNNCLRTNTHKTFFLDHFSVWVFFCLSLSREVLGLGMSLSGTPGDSRKKPWLLLLLGWNLKKFPFGSKNSLSNKMHRYKIVWKVLLVSHPSHPPSPTLRDPLKNRHGARGSHIRTHLPMHVCTYIRT